MKIKLLHMYLQNPRYTHYRCKSLYVENELLGKGLHSVSVFLFYYVSFC